MIAMATAIKPLEGRTVHQIQSGQVIIDLCSVVKELVENSLDAGATSMEVRFKNSGLDSVEVQDNGTGIASDNFETLVLKHYTSKLASYDDLASLETFGFRGEALSSLCALSKFHIVTSQVDQAPKGTKLEYESSGKLKKTSVTASQKGTTVFIEDLFLNLPVRRKELERNIKREYGKVLGVLQAYACISTNARIVVTNVLAKGKKVVVFATKVNSTTRENIANIFGVKALHALAAMELQLDLQSTSSVSSGMDKPRARLLGHVSRPVVGEGRSAPDRQMLFINGRPCDLPQVAKVFNEVYKSYNVSQTPFIFANIILSLNAYDINVSPDKRTIMLHDQSCLLESLRDSLTILFEEQDQKIPLTQKPVTKMPVFKQLSVTQRTVKEVEHTTSEAEPVAGAMKTSNLDLNDEDHGRSVITPDRQSPRSSVATPLNAITSSPSHDVGHYASNVSPDNDFSHEVKNPSNSRDEIDQTVERPSSSTGKIDDAAYYLNHIPLPGARHQESTRSLEDFNERLNEQQLDRKSAISLEVSNNRNSSRQKSRTESLGQPPPPSPGVVSNAFERMRPRRQLPQVATITIGSRTRSAVVGGPIHERCMIDPHSPTSSEEADLPQSDWTNEEKGQQRLQSPNSPPLGIALEHASTSNQCTSDIVNEESSSGEHSTLGSLTGEKVFSISQRAVTSEVEHDLENKSIQSEPARSGEHLDDEKKKAREDAKVAELIRRAEKADVSPTFDQKRHASQMLKGIREKDSMAGLIQCLNVSVDRIDQETNVLQSRLSRSTWNPPLPSIQTAVKKANSLDEQLTLTISKEDFHNMDVIGQFNLGFILATRDGTDLLIIDQHASDEKFNFERLQKTTIVQNQRLVHPRGLELTAFDEEVILNNDDTLLKNGFQVEVDQSGSKPVGQRCKLVSLPMSKEVTFDLSDLEELIALMAESSHVDFSDHIPRPSKVRRMFAMRACRSSIMIGRTLTMTQMQGLLRHMGEIDRPWNCPHGRPTMRHICGLSDWNEWEEGNGVKGLEEGQLDPVDWASWIENGREKEIDQVANG